jgi:hypothetical protein
VFEELNEIHPGNISQETDAASWLVIEMDMCRAAFAHVRNPRYCSVDVV